MDTPNDWAGSVTEDIMSRWLIRLAQRGEKRPETPTYNAAYEAVHEVLAGYEQPRRKR
jgi:hypothetical protein